MRTLAAGFALLVLVAALPAEASCVRALVVDGVLLVGRDAAGHALPPLDGARPAVVPACNDAGQDDPDAGTTVMRLQGVPPDVAVVSGGELFLADGSLTAMASHPLHRPLRHAERRRCGRRRAYAGTATSASADDLTLLATGRDRVFRIDARTRITNRPAYQPVRRGQRLTLTAVRCRRGWIADRIAFAGKAPPARPSQVAEAPGSRPWVLLAGGLVAALAAAALIRRRRR